MSGVKFKTKSALSYFGSDSEVAGQLAAMLDCCNHVTIPFVGGAAIIPHLKARAIVANDLNRSAINFYRVVSGAHGQVEQAALIQRCEWTLSHPEELERAFKFDSDPPDSVSWAWAYWTMCWLGRKGKGGTKSPATMPSVRRTASGGTNASRIKSAADDLRLWAKSFERCEWQQVDFRELLSKVADDPKCGVYCDPPWIGAGDDYLHNFSERDHSDLAGMLSQFDNTTVVVRYGDAPLIRELYSDWQIIEASSRDQCNAVKGELWITNW